MNRTANQIQKNIVILRARINKFVLEEQHEYQDISIFACETSNIFTSMQFKYELCIYKRKIHPVC